MKKIVIYTTWDLDPKKGTGVAVALSSLISLMKKKNIKFKFLNKCVKSHFFMLLTLKRIMNNFFNNSEIAKLKPAIVLGVDFDGFFILKKNYKYILNLRSNFSEIKKCESGIMKITCLIEEFFQKRAVKNADLIIVASNYTRNAVIKNYKLEENKVLIIPNGVDHNLFTANKVIVPRENILLSVSALYPRKGIDFLIKALKILKDQNFLFKYYHIGDGVMKMELQNLVKKLDLEKEVIFLGGISDRKTVARIYNKTKIFCHPCLQEDFGNIFLEAMSSGKPLISFKNSVTPEFITDGKNGFLVENKNIFELADRIKRLFLDNELCYSMGVENIKRASRYDWDKTAVAFIDVFESLSKEKN